MATLFRMPGVSADADEAVLESWSVQQGTTISSGQVIASVETDKAVVDIESDSDAVVHRLLVANGATVPVGDPIAVLIDVDESPEEGEKLLTQLGLGTGSEEQAIEVAVRSAHEEAGAPDSRAADDGGTVTIGTRPAPAAPRDRDRLFATPIARKLARELGVDLSTVAGTGPGGRIRRDDVREAAAPGVADEAEAIAASAAAAPAPAPATTPAPAAPPAPAKAAVASRSGWKEIPHSRLRKLVASRLQASKNTAPHFYLRSSVRVDELLALRAQSNAAGKEKLSVNDFVVKAAARALIEVPEMNVVWTEEAVLQAPTADVAVAVASERGLVTPVIPDVDSLSIAALSARIKDVVARSNTGKLQQSELDGGTLTVSNLGMYGIEEFDAILNPPQAGILAVGAASKRPVVGEDGELGTATIMNVVLSVDHRPVDGAIGAKWLGRFREILENPLQILL
jgi:pyruvate dehydrogenase E2 component (dihydrolipoamide acetyltransferase)